MPAIIGETSKPNRITIRHRPNPDRPTVEDSGLMLDGQIDSALPGRIQYLNYGIAIWLGQPGMQARPYRKVIPWHTIIDIVESF